VGPQKKEVAKFPRQKSTKEKFCEDNRKKSEGYFKYEKGKKRPI